MTGTTPECVYIGGHRDGFDAECHWCVTAKREIYMWALARELAPTLRLYMSPDEWAAWRSSGHASEEEQQ